MSNQTKFFKPSPIQLSAEGVSLPLDGATPRGLFRSKDGVRYIVCDDAERRFAIALDHPNLKPFSYVPLGTKRRDIGQWLGVGSFRLDRLMDYTGKAMFTGTLSVGDNAVSLIIEHPNKGYALREVARGTGGRPDWVYEGWTLLADGKRFFRYRAGQHPPFAVFE